MACVAEDFEIYELIKGAKKTFSVPGDIPQKILTEIMPAFVLSINSIIQSAVQTGVYPADFKLETVIPLPKVYPLAGQDDIRPISLTEKGSSPQSTLIGVILFILYINPIAFPEEITLQVHHLVTEYWRKVDSIPDILPTEEKLEEQLNTTKYMNDTSVQEVVNLNTSLATNRGRVGRLPWWESSGKLLPRENTLLQREVERIKDISDSREMILNAKKTFVFTVNFSENHQFKPLITIPGQQEPLQVVQETKLLGYWLDTSMTPTTHVKYITSIAYKRLWAVSRLKSNGVTQKDITKFFNIKVRSVLESSCPVFFTMLLKKDLVMLE